MQNTDLILKSCEIPAVPMVAMRIINLVDRPNTDLDALQDAIMADQALASRILRMANSSYYGLRRNVDTISDAIVIMGVGTIRNLAVAISTREVYKKFGPLEQMLWEHSLGVSVASSLIARDIRFLRAEEASVAGLLHDVGKVIMNNSQPERFALLSERVYDDYAEYLRKEKELFGFSHAEAGGVFAERWGFPNSLCDPIRMHHFDSEEELAVLEPDVRVTTCIVALANALCLRLGVGCLEPLPDPAINDDAWRKILGISDARYSDIVDTFTRVYVEEKAAFT